MGDNAELVKTLVNTGAVGFICIVVINHMLKRQLQADQDAKEERKQHRDAIEKLHEQHRLEMDNMNVRHEARVAELANRFLGSLDKNTDSLDDLRKLQAQGHIELREIKSQMNK